MAKYFTVEEQGETHVVVLLFALLGGAHNQLSMLQDVGDLQMAVTALLRLQAHS